MDSLITAAARPVLLALARAVGEARPGDVPRDTLVTCAFGSKLAYESHGAQSTLTLSAPPAPRPRRQSAHLPPSAPTAPARL